MNDELQMLYMQARLVRLATNEWGMTMSEVNEIFADNNVYGYVEKLWKLFHMEGDMAVLDDIQDYLTNKGVNV